MQYHANFEIFLTEQLIHTHDTREISIRMNHDDVVFL